MRHFSAEQWCDYVRGVVDAGQRGAMRSHLEAGCGRCRTRLSWLERVFAVAETDRDHAPPERLTRSVKAYFQLQRPAERGGLALLRLPAVYDSWRVAAYAGVRGADNEARYFAFEAGGYTVDLAVGRASASGEREVEGRLLAHPAEPMTDIPTFLISQGEVMVTAFTGEQGYFSAHCGLGRKCELLFLPEGRPAVSVTWESPAPAETAPAS